MFYTASILRGHGLLVTTALVICFGFSFLANIFGLAPIIGAFAAGLILENAHYREVGRWENRHLEDALAPLTALLVPIFFVEMGAQVDLQSFQNREVWGLAAAITAMAILGKQVCAFGVREKGLNRLAVGLGMIPRGEVGLIFANEGRKLVANGHAVVDAGTYSAVVVMVMVTTMVTPPLLKWSLVRRPRGPTGANSGSQTIEEF
jgi:Kef-type K+ transport system membrane component KefB